MNLVQPECLRFEALRMASLSGAIDQRNPDATLYIGNLDQRVRW